MASMLLHKCKFLIQIFIILTTSKGEPTTYWHLDRLDQSRGIDHSPFSPSITAHARPILYVIDSGVDGSHQEFSFGTTTVIPGFNFVDDSWGTQDCMGHGTHVAALAAGPTYGVAGSIGVDIVVIRILDCFGRGSCSSMIRGLEWVHKNHSTDHSDLPAVVVMSVGSRQAECKGVDIITESLGNSNILVIAAAGNSGADACMFHPASAKRAITVGAFGLRNQHDIAWSKSNFGSCVNIFAPGVSIESAWPGSPSRNNSKVLSGTSMAAPLIAGQALLIIAAIPGITAHQVREIIEESGVRGTLLGSHVDPKAAGTRVAHVPWLNADAREIIRIHRESRPSQETSTRERRDVVMVNLKSYSATENVMKYFISLVARNVYSQLTNSTPAIESNKLVHEIECDNLHFPASTEYFVGGHGQHERSVKRGWDFRQRTTGNGLHTLILRCNFTCVEGKGKHVKDGLMHIFGNNHLPMALGKEISLLGTPVLRSLGDSEGTESSNPLRGMELPVLIASILGVILGISVCLFCSYPRFNPRPCTLGILGIRLT